MGEFSTFPPKVDASDWNALLDHGLEKPVSYIIRKKADGTFEAINGSTGKVDYSGTDIATVVQNAISAIKSNGGGKLFIRKSVVGTWNAGTGEDNPFITVDFSNFEIVGEKGHQITLLGQTTAVKAVGTAESPLENIVIRGMNFVGDPTHNESHGIILSYVHDALIEDCKFTDFGDESISLGKGSRNCIVRNNWLVSSDLAGAGAPITLQSGGHLIDGNIITLNTDSVGIHLEAISGTETISKVIIKNNIIYGQNVGKYGIALNRNAFNITDVIIEDNQVYDVILDGISDFSAAGGTEKAIRIVVANNIVKGGGTDTDARGAIRFDKNSPEQITIIGNIVQDYGSGNGDGHGILVSSDRAIVSNNRIKTVGGNGIKCAGDGIELIGNIIKESQQDASTGCIYLSNANDIRVIGNHLGDGYRGIAIDGTSTGGVFIANHFGSHTIPFDNTAGGTFRLCHNLGYVTENSGTATIANGNTSVTFAHGLAGTPTLVVLGATHSEVTDAVWSADATNITITVPNAVSADRQISWYAEYKP